jgi:hypothetical protein
MRACMSKLLKTPYYRSSSHALWIKMPLGANESIPGAHAPRDLACPNRLCVAREKEYSRSVVVRTGDCERVGIKLVNALISHE